MYVYTHTHIYPSQASMVMMSPGYEIVMSIITTYRLSWPRRLASRHQSLEPKEEHVFLEFSGHAVDRNTAASCLITVLSLSMYPSPRDGLHSIAGYTRALLVNRLSMLFFLLTFFLMFIHTSGYKAAVVLILAIQFQSLSFE